MTTRLLALQTEICSLRQKGEYGVYIARVNPMHLGHQAMIETLVEAFGDKHIVLIGSCNRPISIRHLFNYRDRSAFVRAAVPNARILPLPDFEADNETWFQVHDDIFKALGFDARKVVYIGGCKEDTEFLFENGRAVHIVNRYNGPTLHVSASQVRDILIERRNDELDKVLDPRVAKLVLERFPARWNEVRNR